MPEKMLQKGFEGAGLLVVFTLSGFMILVYAVRILAIMTKLPIPKNPLDMARLRGLRALALGAAMLLAPLVTSSFLPSGEMGEPWVLAALYVFEILIGVAVWLALEAYFKMRTKQ
jgi:hypothetical protein